MNQNVLVLNTSWVAQYIVSWEKAVSIIYQDKAKSLDSDFVSYDFAQWLDFSKFQHGFKSVRSSQYTIAIPEIIVLRDNYHIRRVNIKYSRQSVFARDNWDCAYCGKTLEKDEATIDHIIPKSRGGKNVWNNVISSCKKCNAIKGARTPEEACMPLLFQPRKPSWVDANRNKRGFKICKSWKKFLERV